MATNDGGGAGFTPGPWKYGQAVQHNLPAPLIVTTDAGKMSRRICVLEDAGTEADARLVAAAPEMLAACERVMACVLSMTRDLTFLGPQMQQTGVINDIRDAIAKAKGQS